MAGPVGYHASRMVACLSLTRHCLLSYGVLLWELAEQRVPDVFEELHPNQRVRGPLLSAILKLLGQGERLHVQTTTVPGWYRDLSLACMHGSPEERPTMAQICQMMVTHSAGGDQ